MIATLLTKQDVTDETHAAAMGIATAMDVIAEQASDIIALCQDVADAESYAEDVRELLLEALRVTPEPHRARITRQIEQLRQ